MDEKTPLRCALCGVPIKIPNNVCSICLGKLKYLPIDFLRSLIPLDSSKQQWDGYEITRLINLEFPGLTASFDPFNCGMITLHIGEQDIASDMGIVLIIGNANDTWGIDISSTGGGQFGGIDTGLSSEEIDPVKVWHAVKTVLFGDHSAMTCAYKLEDGTKCNQLNTELACGSEAIYPNQLVGHPVPNWYCRIHANLVIHENGPEGISECPNCGCLFGYN